MSDPSPALREIAHGVVRTAKSRGHSLATVESCTAGALACLLANGEGASDVFQGGFVVYTKEAKSAVVGVPGSIHREARRCQP